MKRTARAVIACTLGLLAWNTSAQRGSDPFGEPEQLAVPSLHAEDSAAPGAWTWVSVRFEIPDSWHLYGPFQNDTGFAPILDWDLPEGFGVGEPDFPVPDRHVLPGDILDHIYESELTIHLPLWVPAGARGDQRLGLSLEWLICDDDVCVSEQAELSTTLRIAGAPATRLDDRRAPRHPRWTPADADGVPFRVTLSGTQIRVDAPGARRIDFIPRIGGASVAGLLGAGRADGATLNAEFDGPPAGTVGIVRITPESGNQILSYRIELKTGGLDPDAIERFQGVSSGHSTPRVPPK